MVHAPALRTQGLCRRAQTPAEGRALPRPAGASGRTLPGDQPCLAVRAVQVGVSTFLLHLPAVLVQPWPDTE